jgi:glycosyltransferase involved in cell wall biosynthesis
MDSKPLILVSINTSWNLYNFRAGLIATLRTNGYRIATAAPKDEYTQRLKAMVDAHYDLPMDNAGTSLIKDFLLFIRYVALLRRLRPAALLTYTIKPNIYGAFAAKLLGIPVIANVSGLGTSFIRRNWLTQLVKPLYWLAFHSATYVFFQNINDRDLFLDMKLVAQRKTLVLPGSGVDLDYFHPRHAAARDSAAPMAFVLIARLLWDKGVGEFIEAARRVKAVSPEVVFRLVGPTGMQNKTAIPPAIIAAWVEEGVVEYCGPSNDVRAMIAVHDCVILPSYREGMSRVLLEAAAMGSPLIATDVPGCRQVVEHEKNGFLCRVRDAQDLADAMLRFIRLLPQQRAQMGQASRAKAEQEFNQQAVFDAYLQNINAITSD